MPLSEVYRIVLGGRSHYPLDSLEQRRNFLDAIVKSDLLTLLTDSKDRLEGFLIAYRSMDGAALDVANMRNTGNSVTVDSIWVRPDLRRTGAIRRMIRFALLKNKDRHAGAEKLFIHWRRGPGVDLFRGYDYPRFFRKYTECHAQDQPR